MKYVTFDYKIDNRKETFVVLFNEDSISHAHMAFGVHHAARGSLANINGAVFMGGLALPRSAGLFVVGPGNSVTVFGRSESLNLDPHPGDEVLIHKLLRGVT